RIPGTMGPRRAFDTPRGSTSLRRGPIPRPNRPTDDHPTRPGSRSIRPTDRRCFESVHANEHAQSPNPHVFLHVSLSKRIPPLCKFLNAPMPRSTRALDTTITRNWTCEVKNILFRRKTFPGRVLDRVVCVDCSGWGVRFECKQNGPPCGFWCALWAV